MLNELRSIQQELRNIKYTIKLYVGKCERFSDKRLVRGGKFSTPTNMSKLCIKGNLKLPIALAKGIKILRCDAFERQNCFSNDGNCSQCSF